MPVGREFWLALAEAGTRLSALKAARERVRTAAGEEAAKSLDGMVEEASRELDRLSKQQAESERRG